LAKLRDKRDVNRMKPRPEKKNENLK